jgi:hypothetical protein
VRFTALAVLLLSVFQCGCNDTSNIEDVDELWWIQHLGKLSPDGYVPRDGDPPWPAGLSSQQRSILQDADAAIFFKLRESLPERDHDFGNDSVVGWKRVTNQKEVKPLVDQLCKSIDNGETFYPDSFQASFGARVWRKKEAVDLIISVSERIVHVKDKREHRYCVIPKAESEKLARSLTALDWTEPRKQR